jgi:hypothetical protein
MSISECLGNENEFLPTLKNLSTTVPCMSIVEPHLSDSETTRANTVSGSEIGVTPSDRLSLNALIGIRILCNTRSGV